MAFLCNIKKKQDLCNLFGNIIRKIYLSGISSGPVVIVNNLKTWFITDQYSEKLFEYNHEEANTRMVFTLDIKILTESKIFDYPKCQVVAIFSLSITSKMSNSFSDTIFIKLLLIFCDQSPYNKNRK